MLAADPQAIRSCSSFWGISIKSYFQMKTTCLEDSILSIISEAAMEKMPFVYNKGMYLYESSGEDATYCDLI